MRGGASQEIVPRGFGSLQRRRSRLALLILLHSGEIIRSGHATEGVEVLYYSCNFWMECVLSGSFDDDMLWMAWGQVDLRGHKRVPGHPRLPLGRSETGVLVLLRRETPQGGGGVPERPWSGRDGTRLPGHL